jgi:CRISPR-associated protein Cmr4
LLSLHAQTALHPGAGTALGVVDLPIQRERHTHWPTIAGSALKGILRDHHRERLAGRSDLDDLPRFDDSAEKRAERSGGKSKKADAVLELNELYGPPTEGADKFGGALSITDARILAFPVRSLKGVFAWVSCPEVLRRLQRDAALAGLSGPASLPVVADNQVLLPGDGCPCLIDGKHVVLEEFEFSAAGNGGGELARWLAANLLPAGASHEPTRRRFERHFLILSDNDFTHFVRHATEVSARIGLDYETKTVKGGALFYQEFLPAETVFYAVVLVSPSRSRNGQTTDGAKLLERFRGSLPELLQVGGDETTGKGLCAIRLTRGGQ